MINDTSSNGSLHAPFLAMAMTEQAHHCSSGLTKTFTCVQLSNTYLSATLTTAAFPTAAACRGFDASACTPTPRDLLSSHWQLRLHFIWKGSQPFIYRCAPRGTRTGQCPTHFSQATGETRIFRRTLTCPLYRARTWYGKRLSAPHGMYWMPLESVTGTISPSSRKTLPESTVKATEAEAVGSCSTEEGTSPLS